MVLSGFEFVLAILPEEFVASPGQKKSMQPTLSSRPPKLRLHPFIPLFLRSRSHQSCLVIKHPVTCRWTGSFHYAYEGKKRAVMWDTKDAVAIKARNGQPLWC